MRGVSTARVFLGLNAAFSTITGVALLALPGWLAREMFVSPAGWQATALAVLGGGLLLFAAELVFVASNRNVSRKEIWSMVAADISWVVGSGVLLVLFTDIFTQIGAVLMVGVAAVVSIFALGQFFGARCMGKQRNIADVVMQKSTIVATVKRQVKAPVTAVWQIMTDHPGYADVATNLSKVEVLEGQGLGMRRRCAGPKGESWTETCDLYLDGREYGFKVHTEAPDYPYPIAELTGRWSVEPSEDGAVFSIRIEALPKGGLIARGLFFLLSKRGFTNVLIDLSDAWADRMERLAKEPHSRLAAE